MIHLTPILGSTTMTTLDLCRVETDTATPFLATTLVADAATRKAAVLDVLLSRQSHWPLMEPGPADVELALIVDAALRAPDHGNLRPWRFVTIRGEARGALGDLLVDLACARAPGEPRSAHAHRRQKAFAAPLLIALGAAISAHPKVPEVEQLLAAGAAAMNMLNAIHALGYGGFWATGPDSYETRLHDALGFAPNERLLGFLFVGTPKNTGQPPMRPARSAHVREWLPPQPA
jgi:nitroreductase